MLLRSSSTPFLGSLLSDSPNRSSHPSSSPFPTINSQLSFYQSAPSHLNSISCNSSPISPFVSENSEHCRHSRSGIRRAQSEGNLEKLAYVSEDDNEDRFSDSYPPKHLMLRSIPSFSFEGAETDEEGSVEEEEEKKFGPIQRTTDMVTTNKELLKESFEKERDLVNQNMYQARELGVDGGGFTGGGGFGTGVGGGGGGKFSSGDSDQDDNGIEEYYKKLVGENPGNPLILRNYAQFLYQSRGNLRGAEEYYSRAILMDGEDSEVLSQYAKLVWELHHDRERASSYFERAVQASANDSHIHAAYASFLWETEEEEEDECWVAEQLVNTHTIKPQTASLTA